MEEYLFDHPRRFPGQTSMHTSQWCKQDYFSEIGHFRNTAFEKSDVYKPLETILIMYIACDKHSDMA